MSRIIAKEFNNESLQRSIFRILYKVAQDKFKINSLSDMAEKVGLTQPDLSGMYNARKGVTDYKKGLILDGLGISKKEFEEVVRIAKAEEFKMTYGDDIMPDLGDFSVMNEGDLEEVLLSKNGVKLSDDAKKDLKSYVEFLKNKYPKE